jgi:hypothetical protein
LGRGLATAPKAPKALEKNDFRLLQKVVKIWVLWFVLREGLGGYE